LLYEEFIREQEDENPKQRLRIKRVYNRKTKLFTLRISMLARGSFYQQLAQQQQLVRCCDSEHQQQQQQQQGRDYGV
jgi:hypothetical protein